MIDIDYKRFIYKNKKMVLIHIFILILLCLLSFCSFSQTKQQIYKEIIKVGIKNPKVAYQICIAESNGKNKYGNLFGWRKKKYLKFKNWKQSVVYYKKWENKHYTRHLIKYHYNKDNHCDYYHFIRKIGYIDPKLKKTNWYINKLKSIKAP